MRLSCILTLGLALRASAGQPCAAPAALRAEPARSCPAAQPAAPHGGGLLPRAIFFTGAARLAKRCVSIRPGASAVLRCCVAGAAGRRAAGRAAALPLARSRATLAAKASARRGKSRVLQPRRAPPQSSRRAPPPGEAKIHSVTHPSPGRAAARHPACPPASQPSTPALRKRAALQRACNLKKITRRRRTQRSGRQPQKPSWSVVPLYPTLCHHAQKSCSTPPAPKNLAQPPRHPSHPF